MAGFVGQNTDVDATAEALSPTSVLVKTGVCIKAHPDNTGIVYVGLADTVLATIGFPLAAGEMMSFDVAWFRTGEGMGVGDLADIYVIGSAANQAVCYWGV